MNIWHIFIFFVLEVGVVGVVIIFAIAIKMLVVQLFFISSGAEP